MLGIFSEYFAVCVKMTLINHKYLFQLVVRFSSQLCCIFPLFVYAAITTHFAFFPIYYQFSRFLVVAVYLLTLKLFFRLFSIAVFCHSQRTFNTHTHINLNERANKIVILNFFSPAYTYFLCDISLA